MSASLRSHGTSAALAFLFASIAIPVLACGKTISTPDAAPPSPPKKLTAAECEALFDASSRELAASREETGCRTNDDCALAVEWPCWSGGRTLGVTKTAEPKWRAELERVRRTTCKAWEEGGCPTTTPRAIPTQVPYWPACVAGRCQASPTPPR